MEMRASTARGVCFMLCLEEVSGAMREPTADLFISLDGFASGHNEALSSVTSGTNSTSGYASMLKNPRC